MSHSVLHPTLYTPATTELRRLLDLVNGVVNDGPESAAVWRLVICTEDSIREDQVPEALENIRAVLTGMNEDTRVAVFVRVRTHDVLAQLLELPTAHKLHGFVVPKAEPTSFPLYADQLLNTGFRLMPILEHRLMMDRHFRETLRTVLMTEGYRGMIDCLRIGANDLMGHLGIRRDDRSLTIYDTPVGSTINDIINEFGGLADFVITAPVFECFAPKYDDLLRKEVRHHMMNGLFGQTIIHPRHIRLIRDLYKVSSEELASAQAIVDEDTAAVVGMHGRMDERATHLRWAERIVERHRIFGDNTTSRTGTSLIG